jgi:polyadenylate-binding protein
MLSFTSSSLYVGDLNPDVTEALLFELFNTVGPVASIRVCRDAITRRSLGYAYVNFRIPQDAERAMDTMNFTLIHERPCRIMWSQRDPATRKSGAGNIFIKNLEKSIDNKALYDTFSVFGNILSCKVSTDPEGNSRGYGFVHFEMKEAADQAIEKVNGMLLMNRPLFVGNFVARKDRVDAGFSARYTNVFVKNLAPEVGKTELENMFKEFGVIKSAAVMTNADGTSRCFGFVCFDTPEQAAKAVEAKNGAESGDKKLYVGRAEKRAERQAKLRAKYEQMKLELASKYQGVNLFVKNLDDQVTDEQLRQAFEPFGTINSAKIMQDKATNTSRGFGFVCFATPEEATKAMTEMNSRILANKPLYVALAQRKEERQAQLAQQYAASVMRMPQGPMQPQPMYAGGPALYYNMGARPMMYQHQVPRHHGGGPWNQGGVRPGYQQVPQYINMPPQQQQQMSGSNPGRGGQRGGRGGRGSPAGARSGAAPQARQGGAARGMGYKMTPNVRNPPSANIPLTASMLTEATPDIQKQMLGERLYPLIHQQQPELAGKITGMLLEMDNTELLHLLDTPEALLQKVQEAVSVLQVHSSQAI